MKKILIVEDDENIAEMLSDFLKSFEFELNFAKDYRTALRKLNSFQPDLLLLDWMIPGKSGVSLLKHVKKTPEFKQIPIIMLTAKIEDENCISCLNLGADDYVTKPFSLKNLLARINAVLRRYEKETGDLFKFHDLNFELNKRSLKYGQQQIILSENEFNLLYFLAKNENKVFSRELLLNDIWQNDQQLEPRSVDVYVQRVRKKLEQLGLGKIIHTIRGKGYCLLWEDLS